MTLYADRVGLIDTENAFKMGPFIKQVEDGGHKVVKCNLGEPDFALPAHIREEVKRQLDNDMTHYNDPQGILPLREAIAKEFGATRGISASPQRVVVFPGAKPPIGFAQQTYCNPGDEVIYPSPGYPIYESFTSYVGAKAVPLHLKEENGFSFTGHDLEPLISKKTKLIYINFPSNPTGGVASKAQLTEIAEVIKRKAPADVRVYADEVYENILFDGSTHNSIASFLPENTILASGVSKTYSWTGGRVGWALFPTEDEAQVFKNLNINYFSCISGYNQMGAKVAIESPESKVAIKQMVAAFQERRDVVVAGLNAIKGITCQKPKGAFYVFPNIAGVVEKLGALELYQQLPEDIKKRTSPSSMFQMFLLFQHHVASMDRKSFGRIGTENMHFLRLSVATGIDDLRRGLVNIANAADDKTGFQAYVKGGGRLF